MEKRKRLNVRVLSATNEAFVVEIDKQTGETPEIGDGLIVTIPSNAKVRMFNRVHSTPRVTDTIARGKVVEVTNNVVTVKPMDSRTNVQKLQSIASNSAKVGISTIKNRIRVQNTGKSFIEKAFRKPMNFIRGMGVKKIL